MQVSDALSEDDFLIAENFSTIRSLRRRVAFVRRPFRHWRVRQGRGTPSLPTTRGSTKREQGAIVIEPLTPEELQEAEI